MRPRVRQAAGLRNRARRVALLTRVAKSAAGNNRRHRQLAVGLNWPVGISRLSEMPLMSANYQ